MSIHTKLYIVIDGDLNELMFDFFQLRGTLTLTPETELNRLPSESKKKGFKFELKTMSPNGDMKINRFKVCVLKNWELKKRI